jgi:TPR repeat protein
MKYLIITICLCCSSLYAGGLYENTLNSNDAAAQLDLGMMYFKDAEFGKSLPLLQKSANQGNAIAQNTIGAAYQEAWGVSQDYTKALYWYSKAADQGYGPSLLNLGVMYQQGLGVQQDYAKALSGI